MCLGLLEEFITNCRSLALRIKAFSDIFHVSQGGSYIHITAVQEHTKQSVSVTRVGNQRVAKITAFTM